MLQRLPSLSVSCSTMFRPLASLVLAAALSAGPVSAQGGFLGVHLEPAQDGATGARIARVEERTTASIMGLKSGDLVTSVDGVAVADPGALAQLIGARLPGDVVELTVVRDGASSTMLGVLARRPGLPRVAAPMGPPLPRGHAPEADFQMEGFELPEFNFAMPPMQFDLRGWDPALSEELRAEMERVLQDRQQWMEDLHRQLQDMEFRFRPIHPGDMQDGSSLFEFHGDRGRIFVHPGEPLKADAQTSVRLRYPASTTAEERERLQKEAQEKYGPEVQVEFMGEGTSMIIERRRNVGGAAEPATPVPPTPPETTREF